MRCGFVNPPIYFDIALEIAVGDHLTYACDFGEGFGDKILATKTGVDGHDEDHVEKREHVFEHENRRRWRESDGGLFAHGFNLLYDAVQVWGDLLVYDDDVRAGIGKVL